MSDIRLYKSTPSGEISVCASKSVAHRAVIIAALSGGGVAVKNVTPSKDIYATLRGLEALGIDFSYENNTVVIGKGEPLKNKKLSFNADESGSTLRFLIPVFTALNNETEFSGKGRLPNRPLDDYLQIFDKNEIEYEKGEGYLPLKVKGTFKYNTFEVKGNVSSQYITGLMLSALSRDEEITINITTPLESKGYVEITKKVLEDFGHSVYFKENIIKVKKRTCKINEYTVESDWSQGAFFLALGAISGDVALKNMNLSSFQGDKEIVDILVKMGASVTIGDSFVRVKKSKLKGISTDVSSIPDLVPILSVLGAVAEGETRLYNGERLRYKESDRIESVCAMLTEFGVNVKSGKDFILINGCENFKNAVVDSYNDHRIVMSASVLSALSEATVIKSCEAVEKSYPDFFEDLYKLGIKGEII